MKFAKIILGTGLIVALGVGTFTFTYNKVSKIEDEKAKAEDSVDVSKLLDKAKSINAKEVNIKASTEDTTEVSSEDNNESSQELEEYLNAEKTDNEDSLSEEANSDNSKEVNTDENNLKDTNLNIAKKEQDSMEKALSILKSAESSNQSNSNKEATENNFIFIGDSRTVAYKDVVDIKDYDFVTFIAKVSQGYDWLSTEALNKLQNRLDTTDLKYDIILNLGVNDLNNINKYISFYNKLAKDNPNHNFYVVSVNPGDDSKLKANGYKYTSNAKIEAFNNKMKESLNDNIKYIDSYSHFMKNGFDTVDGLHYTTESSKNILNFVSDTVKSLK